MVHLLFISWSCTISGNSSSLSSVNTIAGSTVNIYPGYCSSRVKKVLAMNTYPRFSEPAGKKLTPNITMPSIAFSIHHILVSFKITGLAWFSSMVSLSWVCIAVERLVAAYQAAPGLNRLGRPSSMSFLFTEIMNDGAFRGSLRGLSMSFLQASLVLWPSIALNSNKPDVSVTDFLKTYLFFDFLLYPLDNIKNRMYAETANPQSRKSSYLRLGVCSLESESNYLVQRTRPKDGLQHSLRSCFVWNSQKLRRCLEILACYSHCIPTQYLQGEKSNSH